MWSPGSHSMKHKGAMQIGVAGYVSAEVVLHDVGWDARGQGREGQLLQEGSIGPHAGEADYVSLSASEDSHL